MELSIILINYDWNLCKKTLSNVKHDADAAGYETEIRVANFTDKKYSIKNEQENTICSEIYHMNSETISFSQIIEDCRGQYIMFLNSGDCPQEDFFKNLMENLEKNSAAVLSLEGGQVSHNKLMEAIKHKSYLNLRDNNKFMLNPKQAFIIKRTELQVPCDLSSLEAESQLWCHITYALTKIQSAKILSNCRISLSPAYTNLAVQSLSAQELYNLFQIMGNTFSAFFKKQTGTTPRILQYQQALLINSLLKNSPSLLEELSSEQSKALDTDVVNLIMQMDFDVLLSNTLHRTMILYAHKQYPQSDLQLAFTGREYLYYTGNEKIMSLSRYSFSIRFIHIEGNQLYLEGISGTPLADVSDDVFVCVNGQMHQAALKPHNSTIVWLDKTLSKNSIFSIELELDPAVKEYKISFFVQHGDTLIQKIVVQLGKYVPVDKTLRGSYYYRDGWMLEFNSRTDCLQIQAATPAMQKEKEKAFQAMLLKHPNIAARKAALVRKIYFAQKKTQKREIWLISDRTNRIDDNGEAFFRYVVEQKDRLKDKDIYFVLEKGSNGYDDLKKLGKIISPMSWKHKMLHLLSSYVISSQGNDPVVNPFHKKHIYYRDIVCDMRFVFLQHGVIKDDLSSWLNKYNRNMYGFITSTKAEYDSILEYDYYYTADKVWLTGLPRYDLLYHDEKKYITIMPTWRKSLMSGADPQTGIWLLKEGFEESLYVKFYNALLNDERLLSEAKRLGYKICFMPHPIVAPYLSYFTKHPEVEFFDAHKSYRQVFAEADLMLTDYSSVAFDFAYLRKPIVYSQFDYQDFFNGAHSYTEGYFDYEQDGFGEITHDLESTIDLLIDYMRNNCELKPKYRDRINSTFAFSNEKCSERILKKILGEDK